MTYPHKCLPNDILAYGTEVMVQGKKGTVMSAEVKKDQHGAPITVHTIWFPHNKRKIGITKEVNYSFINYR